MLTSWCVIIIYRLCYYFLFSTIVENGVKHHKPKDS